MSDDIIPVDPVAVGATRRKLLTGMGAAAAGGGLLALAGTQTAQAAVGEGTYFSLGPLRFVDTREEGGRISGGQTRTLVDFEGAEDFAFVINLTVTSTKGTGYLSVFNADLAERPNPYSSINWQGADKTVANFNVVDGGEAGVKVYCSGGSSTSTHFIIDLIGFFASGDLVVPENVKAWRAKAKQRVASRQSR